MRYNRLGSTGLVVSELCLGTMTFGSRETRFSTIAGLDQAASTALVKQAFDAGINFIDTANIYSLGQSEEFTGRALKDLGIPRSDIIVATKATSFMGEGPNDYGASRFHLLNQVDESLERLGLDHVDLFQIHAWDPVTPVEESLRALEDIVRSGRARYVGVSNWAAWQVMKALGIADRRGFDRLACVQAYYTVAGRDLEREIVPLLESEGLGLLAWSPLAGGLLSGKYRRGDAGIEGDGRRARFDFPPVDLDRAYGLVDAMAPMAQARNCSVGRIAIAWLLHRPAVTSVILGATREDQLADNIAACDVELDAPELSTLDALSALPSEYPGWMLQGVGGYENRVSPRRQAK
ncbi:MAG: aldo/keto reductase [Novosphingobium sp.]|nr:aldo/keto reductase [Novosphingobium sp.]MCP5401935.1 aldo/keto reductase [Novosphingobium sp.]